MSVQISLVGNRAVLSVSGRFVFAIHGEFRKCAQEVLDQPQIEHIEINLQDAEYLDSAALGMLLLLRERAMKARKQPIRITGSSGRVRGVLDMCNFDQMFVIA